MSQPRKMLISSFTLQKEHLLLLCCCFIYNWVSFAQKYTVSLSTLQKKLQELCSVSSGRKKARWRKSKLKCLRWNIEASSQELLRLSDHAPQTTHCNEHHRDEQHMQLLVVNWSKSWIMGTIPCTKLISPMRRLTTKCQSLWGSSFISTPNCEYWSCTTTFSPNSVLSTISKSWNWTQNRCILLLPRSNGKFVSDMKRQRNGRGCDQMTVSIV